jgi:hypothetical protein
LGTAFRTKEAGAEYCDVVGRPWEHAEGESTHLKGRDHLGDLEAEVRIILRLSERNMMEGVGFTAGTDVGPVANSSQHGKSKSHYS